MIPRFDLVVRGGTIVTPGRREIADLGVRDGRIAQIGGAMAGGAELGAHGLLVIPSGVDAHVHLVCAALAEAVGPEEPAWVDDFWTGSLAALAGGITTIGNMTFALPGESMTAAIGRDMAGASAEAAADWFLHPVLAGLGGGTEAEIAALAADGHASLKVFLSNPEYAAGTPGVAGAIAAAGRAGSLTLVHCEDAGILAETGQELIGAGRGAVRHFPDARPVSAEVAAVDDAIGLTRRSGAPVYIVHLSSAAALDRCRQARAAGLPVYVETRPLYLHLTRERFAEPDAAKYVGAPPLRDQPDRDALWRGLGAGDVRHGLQRSRAVDSRGQARPGPERGDGAARSGRPRDAHAHAVLGGGRDRADLAGPLRRTDLGQRGPLVRPLPQERRGRRRLRRRSRAMGSAGAQGHRRRTDAFPGGLFGL